MAGEIFGCVVERVDSDKDRVVEEGNRHKFTNGKESPEILKKLLETGDRELVEVYDNCNYISPWLRLELTNVMRRLLPLTEFGALDSAQQRQKRTVLNGARTYSVSPL